MLDRRRFVLSCSFFFSPLDGFHAEERTIAFRTLLVFPSRRATSRKTPRASLHFFSPWISRRCGLIDIVIFVPGSRPVFSCRFFQNSGNSFSKLRIVPGPSSDDDATVIIHSVNRWICARSVTSELCWPIADGSRVLGTFETVQVQSVRDIPWIYNCNFETATYSPRIR